MSVTALLLLIAMTTACNTNAAASHEPSSSGYTESCAITSPNGSNPPGAAWSGVNHGNEKIWVALSPDGRIVAKPPNMDADGSISKTGDGMRGPGRRVLRKEGIECRQKPMGSTLDDRVDQAGAGD